MAVELERRNLEQIADALGLGFYLLILGCLFALVTGSLGFAVFFLIVAGGAHAGRWALEDFVAEHGEPARIALRLPDVRR